LNSKKERKQLVTTTYGIPPIPAKREIVVGLLVHHPSMATTITERKGPVTACRVPATKRSPKSPWLRRLRKNMMPD